MADSMVSWLASVSFVVFTSISFSLLSMASSTYLLSSSNLSLSTNDAIGVGSMSKTVDIHNIVPIGNTNPAITMSTLSEM